MLFLSVATYQDPRNREWGRRAGPSGGGVRPEEIPWTRPSGLGDDPPGTGPDRGGSRGERPTFSKATMEKKRGGASLAGSERGGDPRTVYDQFT
jgi:hypothetical protein